MIKVSLSIQSDGAEDADSGWKVADLETDAPYNPDVAQDMVNRTLELMGVGLEFLRDVFVEEEE